MAPTPSSATKRKSSAREELPHSPEKMAAGAVLAENEDSEESDIFFDFSDEERKFLQRFIVRLVFLFWSRGVFFHPAPAI